MLLSALEGESVGDACAHWQVGVANALEGLAEAVDVDHSASVDELLEIKASDLLHDGLIVGEWLLGGHEDYLLVINTAELIEEGVCYPISWTAVGVFNKEGRIG